MVLTISSGIISAIDKYQFEKKRLYPIIQRLKRAKQRDYQKIIKGNKAFTPPLLANYSRSLFGTLLFVFIIRGFLIESFLIPSSSMEPTLPTGNVILVNKTIYGVRNPFSNKVWISVSKPQRGDIVVFKFPVNPKVNFIKRVIGIPGDIISYQNKQLFVNNKSIIYTNCIREHNGHDNNETINRACYEHLTYKPYKINIINKLPSIDFMSLQVPKGMYFVMGDNRDNSVDSRYWGFVKEEQLVGKASLVWFSWNSVSCSIRWYEIGKTI